MEDAQLARRFDQILEALDPQLPRDIDYRVVLDFRGDEVRLLLHRQARNDTDCGWQPLAFGAPDVYLEPNEPPFPVRIEVRCK